MTKQEKYHIKLKEQREAQYEMISLTITKNIKRYKWEIMYISAHLILNNKKWLVQV